MEGAAGGGGAHQYARLCGLITETLHDHCPSSLQRRWITWMHMWRGGVAHARK